MQNNKSLTWKDLRKMHEPVELCKVIMRDYLILGNFSEVCRKYDASYDTIRRYLNRNYKIFDKEAKKLNEKMEIQIEKKFKRLPDNSRGEKVKRKAEEGQILDKSINENECIHLNCLDEFPRVIKYIDFLNVISRFDVHTLTTNDWLLAAKKKGIKVVG